MLSRGVGARGKAPFKRTKFLGKEGKSLTLLYLDGICMFIFSLIISFNFPYLHILWGQLQCNNVCWKNILIYHVQLMEGQHNSITSLRSEECEGGGSSAATRYLNLLTTLMRGFKQTILSLERIVKCIIGYSQPESAIKTTQQLLEKLQKISDELEEIQINPSHNNIEKRLFNRLLEIIGLYRQKEEATSTFALLGKYISQVQDRIQECSKGRTRVCAVIRKLNLIFERCLKNIEEEVNVSLGRVKTESIKKGPSKRIQGNMLRRTCRSKWVKDMRENYDLFCPCMEVDYDHFRLVMGKVKQNPFQLERNCKDHNDVAIKQQQQYRKGYVEWKNKKKNQTKKLNEKKPDQNTILTPQKRYSSHIQNKPILQQSNREKRIEFDKTFINLTGIRSRNYRKPYPQMKQVIVSGNQLSFYSSKKYSKEQEDSTSQRKISYIMSRGFKMEANPQNKTYNRKKSLKDRLLTE